GCAALDALLVVLHEVKFVKRQEPRSRYDVPSWERHCVGNAVRALTHSLHRNAERIDHHHRHRLHWSLRGHLALWMLCREHRGQECDRKHVAKHEVGYFTRIRSDMETSGHAVLSQWVNFYVIVGSSAGGVYGLCC